MIKTDQKYFDKTFTFYTATGINTTPIIDNLELKSLPALFKILKDELSLSLECNRIIEIIFSHCSPSQRKDYQKNYCPHIYKRAISVLKYNSTTRHITSKYFCQLCSDAITIKSKSTYKEMQ